MTKRLYFQVHLGFFLVGLLCVVFAGLAGWATSRQDRGQLPRPLEQGLIALAEDLPADEPQALAELADRLGLDLALWSQDGVLIEVTDERPVPDRPPRTGHWLHDHHGPSVAVTLPDGRVLAAYEDNPHTPAFLLRALLILLSVAAAVSLGTYPLARRVTRRVEALRAAAEDWGRGELSARVPVEGEDEVAQLALSFNHAAERIEGLVERQRRVLASASHELRSPLARLRMALELVREGEADEALLDEAVADVEELDALIGDLLLAARADTSAPALQLEPLDLLPLLREEAARVGAEVRGEAATLQAAPRLLRRALRNLLENAAKHGGGQGIEAWIEAEGSVLRIVVADRGPGVPEDLRERIFEPFFRPEGHREGADGGVGLGLALVRQIAERHGGSVICEAREGGGSRFVLSLPRG
ncbi:MAG: HAMP domain-containing histidine kinase [Alphaproteobacteria bacterium]|nr:HAMP domain-containing histidine kinase [Alphaproteobacteria bacterium]MCB9795393.1 HAMP domain-containing histidine kinase [Alphaproteobacteria bacterium]